jgi:hypothetical protein
VNLDAKPVLPFSRREESILAIRANALIFVLVAATLLGACSDEESRRPPKGPPEASAASFSRSEEAGTTAASTTVPMPPTAEEADCPAEDADYRIGDFAPPEEGTVPPYEVLEEERVEQDCAEALRLLVDTRARDKAGYTLIARDLKSRHKDLDAVSVEFTDTEDTFSYAGAALIFNTSAGARFIGYAYGAPNDDGYYVSVADK